MAYKSKIVLEKEKTSRFHRKRRRKAFGAFILLLIYGCLFYLLATEERGPVFEMALLTVAGITGIILVYLLLSAVIRTLTTASYALSPLSKVDKMTGDQFENYCLALLNKAGYKATRIGGSYDYGADLLITKYSGLKTDCVVQCKRYSAHVGNSAIQEAASAARYYKADRSCVITNSYFTKSAKALAQANDVILIDRDRLKKRDFRL